MKLLLGCAAKQIGSVYKQNFKLNDTTCEFVIRANILKKYYLKVIEFLLI